MEGYVPSYNNINETHATKTVVTFDEWNGLFNTLATQGNSTAQSLYDFIALLESTGGAADIGGATITGVAGTTIQTIMAGLKALIDACYTKTAADALLATKETVADANQLVKTVTFNSADGKFTITTQGGTVSVIDTALEKVAVNFAYNAATQALDLTLADGSTTSVPLSAFITETEFLDSSTIDFSVNDHVVTATIKDGSITDTMLNSAIITAVIAYKDAAATSATNAAASEANALTYKNSAADSAAIALASKLAAQTAQGLAETAKTGAELAETNAETAETNAVAAKNAAETAQGLAEGARDTAVTAKDNAVLAKTAAETAQGLAEIAKTAAETAETNAELAETNAETAQGLAESARDSAVTAKNAAQTAQTNAETAEAHAETAETNAETAEANATAKAILSESYAKGGTGSRAGEDTDNAKYYKEQATAIVGGDYPTKTEAQGYADTAETNAKNYTDAQKGQANGVASLGSDGKIPIAQLPLQGILPQVVVSTDISATVTATNEGNTVYAVPSGNLRVINIPYFGTWEILATKNGKTESKNILVDSVKIYEAELQFYRVYGFTINEGESNPLAMVAYTDKAVNYGKGAADWDTSPLFENVKPCLFKNGAVVGYLQRNDYTKFEDGSSADITSGDAGDVMVEIPKMAYYMEKSENIITAKVLIGDIDAKTVDARYSYLPFSRDAEGDRDKIYIGAYLGFDLSSKLRSLSGKTPTASRTISAFRTLAQANGTGYQQLPFYPLTLLQILYIMKYGSLNSQTALGRGYVDGNAAATATGSTNAKGFCFGETTGKQQMKIFGIEDFWGNLYQRIDGLFCNASWAILTTYKAFNDTGSGYLFNNASGNSANTSGYAKKVQGGTQTGFTLKAAAGSETTYYADGAGLNADRLPFFGGSWAYASYAGAFRLYVSGSTSDASSNVGARLCYI